MLVILNKVVSVKIILLSVYYPQIICTMYIIAFLHREIQI